VNTERTNFGSLGGGPLWKREFRLARVLGGLPRGVPDFCDEVCCGRHVHGMHEQSRLDPFKAELVLGVCAACIVFLVRSHEQMMPASK